MADLFDDWYVHTVDVETVGAPDEWGAPTITVHKNVPCWVEDQIEMVRNQDGQEEVSTSTVFVALEDADKFKPGSLVTYNGRTPARVITVSTADSVVGDDLDGAEVRLA